MNAADLPRRGEALDLTDADVLAAAEREVHERVRRHASADPALRDGLREELGSANRTLTRAARAARVVLLAGGRMGRDILQWPAYQIPLETGEGGGTETLAGLSTSGRRSARE